MNNIYGFALNFHGITKVVEVTGESEDKAKLTLMGMLENQGYIACLGERIIQKKEV